MAEPHPEAGLTRSDNLRLDRIGFRRRPRREKNKINRRTVPITLLTDDGKPLRRWDFVGVVLVDGRALIRSERARGFVEELEMAHHGFKASNV